MIVPDGVAAGVSQLLASRGAASTLVGGTVFELDWSWGLTTCRCWPWSG